MDNPEQLAKELHALAERHGLTIFVESDMAGAVVYHLMGQDEAWTRILSDWQPAMRIN